METTSDLPPEPVSATGRRIRERAQGEKAQALGSALHDLDPALLEWTDSFVFGTVWSRPGLEYEQRMLVAITALASLGQLRQLRNYFHGALQAGMSPQVIREALMMLPVYAGFPTALNALDCWKQALEAHERAHGPTQRA